MELATYLSKHLSESSQKIYLFEINHFRTYFGVEKSEQVGYEEMMGYLAYLRSRYDNPMTIRRILQALKHYFFYLIEIGKREDHPCRYIRIRDGQSAMIQLQDLLSGVELEALLTSAMNRKERYELLSTRNQVVMSMLIYQALRVSELCGLRVYDVNLEKGILFTKGSPKTEGRSLPLKSNQIMVLYQYMNEVRPKLLTLNQEKCNKGTTEDQLILTKRGTAEKGEGIHYLVGTFGKRKGRRLTPTLIRQSVIAHHLKQGKDLRVVQVFAGHKKPSTTERYRQNNLDALRQAIDKYHPL